MKKKKEIRLVLLLAAILLSASLLSSCTDTNKKTASSGESRSASSAISSETESIYESEPSSESSDVSSDSESLPFGESSGESDLPANAVPIQVETVELSDLDQYGSTQITWGPGHQMDEANRPTACTGLQEKYGAYDSEFIMPAEEKIMYLTFDEGYENGYTAKILDVLKEKECPAVFFVTYDYVKRNPELVQRMVDEGHVVGNHSMNHPNMTKIDADTAAKEIADLHNYVVEQFNFQMTLFRPPEGAFSERSLAIAQKLGYKTVLWSYAYNDWDPKNQMEPEVAFPKVTGAAHNGAIYLLHAVSSTNTDILGNVIDTFRNEGYSLEKLS